MRGCDHLLGPSVKSSGLFQCPAVSAAPSSVSRHLVRSRCHMASKTGAHSLPQGIHTRVGKTGRSHTDSQGPQVRCADLSPCRTCCLQLGSPMGAPRKTKGRKWKTEVGNGPVVGPDWSHPLQKALLLSASDCNRVLRATLALLLWVERDSDLLRIL